MKQLCCVVLLSISFICNVSIAQNQLVVKDVQTQQPKIEPVKKIINDSIISISVLGFRKDTLRIGQEVAVMISTSKPLDQFNQLFIFGRPVADSSYVQSEECKTQNCDKVLIVKFGDLVKKEIEKYIENAPPDKMYVSVMLSVGTKKGKLFECAKGGKRIFVEIKPQVNTIWAWPVIVILILLIWLGLRNNILKDDTNLYYSLGRTQLFFWTVLFVGGYLLIWFKRGSLPEVTSSVLVLLGISAGTTAAGKLIENENKDKVEIHPLAKSDGFLIDILSDGTSISIHRFQNVLFTIVFGVIFIQRCTTAYSMPVFDSNALMLIGISSGIYAGLKITEPLKDHTHKAPATGTDKKEEKASDAT